MKDKTYLLFPSYLGLKLGLAVDIDNLKFLYKDREPEEGPPNRTRSIWGVNGDVAHLLELFCYYF